MEQDQARRRCQPAGSSKLAGKTRDANSKSEFPPQLSSMSGVLSLSDAVKPQPPRILSDDLRDRVVGKGKSAIQ